MITRREADVQDRKCGGCHALGSFRYICSGHIFSRPQAATRAASPPACPFLARFTDVAKQAGLTAPDHLRRRRHKRLHPRNGRLRRRVHRLRQRRLAGYSSCLSGTRLEGAPPGATNRLYKNNRDGTFTDVTEKAGLTRSGWASGGHRRRLQQRRLRRPLHHLLGPERPLPQQRRRHVHRCHRRRPGLLQNGSRVGLGLHLCRLRPRRPPRPVRRQLPGFRLSKQLPKPGENANCNWKGVPVNCGPRGLPPGSCRSITTTATARSPMSARQSGIVAGRGQLSP